MRQQRAIERPGPRSRGGPHRCGGRRGCACRRRPAPGPGGAGAHPTGESRLRELRGRSSGPSDGSWTWRGLATARPAVPPGADGRPLLLRPCLRERRSGEAALPVGELGEEGDAPHAGHPWACVPAAGGSSGMRSNSSWVGAGRWRPIRRQGLRARKQRLSIGPQRREEPLLQCAVRIGVRPVGAGEPPSSTQALPARRPVPGVGEAFRVPARLGHQHPMAVRPRPSSARRRVLRATKKEVRFGNPPGPESTRKRVGFASHSSRWNGGAGFLPIQRSRGPHVKAPFCHAAQPSHGPLRPRSNAGRGAPPADESPDRDARPSRRPSAAVPPPSPDELRSRTGRTRRGSPGTPGRLPCGRASPCPEHRTGSTRTPEGAGRAGPSANLRSITMPATREHERNKRGNALATAPDAPAAAGCPARSKASSTDRQLCRRETVCAPCATRLPKNRARAQRERLNPQI